MVLFLYLGSLPPEFLDIHDVKTIDQGSEVHSCGKSCRRRVGRRKALHYYSIILLCFDGRSSGKHVHVEHLDLHTTHIYSLYVHLLDIISLMSSHLMISTIVARSQSLVYLYIYCNPY